MNTQQVSPVRTVNASAAWWENTLRNDGFVKNINATNEHDVIAAKVVIERMSQRANRSCGLYYEIYERTFLGLALDYVEQLPLSHRPAFFNAAAEAGFILSFDEFLNSSLACDDLMNDLRENGDY